MSSTESSIGTLAGTLLGDGGTDWSAVTPYTSALSGVAGQFSNLGLSSLGQYDTDDAAYRSAMNNYATYLSEDPYTDTQDAADINQATAGLSDAYNKAESSLSANLAARGIDPSSSMAVGGMAGIESARAGSIASAENTLANNAVANHASRLQGLLSLMGGAASTDYSRGTGALNSARSADGTLASLGLQEDEYNQNRADKNSNAITGALSSIGGGLGSIF